jgi:hypothetical protein
VKLMSGDSVLICLRFVRKNQPLRDLLKYSAGNI